MDASVFANIKNFLKTVLPQPVKDIIKKIRIFALKGSRFYCSLCNRGYRKFFSFGINLRPNARCPGYGSFERHRLLWVAFCKLRDKGMIQGGHRLLHVTSEPCLAEKVQQKYDCLSIDLDGIDI